MVCVVVCLRVERICMRGVVFVGFGFVVELWEARGVLGVVLVGREGGAGKECVWWCVREKGGCGREGVWVVVCAEEGGCGREGGRGVVGVREGRLWQGGRGCGGVGEGGEVVAGRE